MCMLRLFVDRDSVTRQGGPIFVAFLLGMLGFSLPMWTVPVYLHHDLRCHLFTIALVLAPQFLATLLTRRAACRICRQSGAHRAMLVGLLGAVASGCLFLLATDPALGFTCRLAMVLCGRVAMGAADSLVMLGALAWAMGRVGHGQARMIMTGQMLAFYLALGMGAPLGLLLNAAGGFALVGTAIAVVPLLGLLLCLALAAQPAADVPSQNAIQIGRAIAILGVGLLLSTFGIL
jgi:predicted MFS family arabinose efflux permease